MNELSSDLLPTAERAVFLLAIPPKSLFHDQHRCVQLQRIVSLPDSPSLRIRPIFNLEYHKMFATRVIELEDDDAKVAEFHPVKGHHEDSEQNYRHNGNSIRRRKRAFSIEAKTGSLGGHVTSQAKDMGLCDMVVTGSEQSGNLSFTCANQHSYEWKKTLIDDSVCWVLQSSVADVDSNAAPNPVAPRPRTSYEFGRQPERHSLARTGTSLTLASQYTTHFNNESQLSGLTSSPQVDPRDLVPNKHLPDRTGLLDQQARAVLAVSPVPHVKIRIDKSQVRTSMREITREEEETYRILLCTLWLIWSSPDFVFEPPETQHQLQASLGDRSPTEDLTLVDRHSKAGLSKALSDHSVDHRRKSSTPGVTSQQSPERKKIGVFGIIAKICGG